MSEIRFSGSVREKAIFSRRKWGTGVCSEILAISPSRNNKAVFATVTIKCKVHWRIDAGYRITLRTHPPPLHHFVSHLCNQRLYYIRHLGVYFRDGMCVLFRFSRKRYNVQQTYSVLFPSDENDRSLSPPRRFTETVAFPFEYTSVEHLFVTSKIEIENSRSRLCKFILCVFYIFLLNFLIIFV